MSCKTTVTVTHSHGVGLGPVVLGLSAFLAAFWTTTAVIAPAVGIVLTGLILAATIGLYVCAGCVVVYTGFKVWEIFHDRSQVQIYRKNEAVRQAQQALSKSSAYPLPQRSKLYVASERQVSNGKTQSAD